MPYVRTVVKAKSVVSLSILCLSLFSCDKKSSETAAPQESLAAQAQGNEESNPISVDYLQQYCTEIDKVQLRSDVKSEMGFFCKNGRASADFRKFYENALTQAPGAINLTPITIKHDSDTGYSQIQLAWSFHVPIKIADFRNKPLADALANPYDSALVSQTTKVEKNSEESLDNGLHFASLNFSYDLTIKAPSGLTINNQRRTQYNLYQVQGGNENLGLGVEHLLESSANDYQKATMLNYSLSAPEGKGGSVVVTLLSFTLANQGFAKTAQDSIEDIAKHVAGEMYKALQ